MANIKQDKYGDWVDEYGDPATEIDLLKEGVIEPDKSGAKPFSVISSRMKASFAASPDEAIDFLKRTHPNLEFATAGNLDRLVWKDPKDKDNTWHYVDPNVGGGLKEYVSDVAELASDVFPVGLGAAGAVGGAAAGAPTGPGAVASTVAGAGLGSAGGEAINRGIARVIGVTPEKKTVGEDVKDVAIAGALGAGAEFGAPYLMRGAKGLIKKAPQIAEKIPVLGKQITKLKFEDKVEKELFEEIYHNVPSVLQTEIDMIADPALRAQAEDEFKELFRKGISNPNIVKKESQALLDKYGITNISQGKKFTHGATSNTVVDDFNEFSDAFNKAKLATKQLKQPPSEGLETFTSAMDIPQAKELRRENIKHVSNVIDNLEESLAPQTQLPGMPEIPLKGASREELEKGLKDTFLEEWNQVKIEHFEPIFENISQATSQIPFTPQAKLSLDNRLNSVKVIAPEAKEAIAEIKSALAGATNIADIYNLKRNELKAIFKSSDKNVQRQLSMVYDAFNKGIEDAIQNPTLKQTIKDTNSQYHEFITNYGKIFDQIEKGMSKGGLQTSKIFDKPTIKYLENMTGEADIDRFFGGTINTYQRVLLNKIKEKLFKEGFTAESFAKELQNIAKDPIQYAYFRDMLGATLGKTGADSMITNYGQAFGGGVALENIMKEAGQQGSSRLFVPPFGKKDVFTPKDLMSPNFLASILRGGMKAGPTPYVGEAIYKPGKFAGRTVARSLQQQLSNKKENK